MYKDDSDREEILSKVVRAGRRTYFFDVKETRAGDYYLTITESKKTTHEDGTFNFKKHKIYLYKEDFKGFGEALKETQDFIISNKGEEVISEIHDSNYEPTLKDNLSSKNEEDGTTDLKFEDI